MLLKINNYFTGPKPQLDVETEDGYQNRAVLGKDMINIRYSARPGNFLETDYTGF